MPAQVRNALDRVTGAVRQFSIAQLTLGIIGIAVLVLGAVALSSWLSKPTMTPLFSGLSGTDASAVVDHVKADGVQYQLADGGTTVLVPAGNVYAERIALAAAGLPTNADGGGYSLLDKMSMTSSDFQQQTTYQRALEGELAKTVGAIDGVQSASVKLAIPTETVFVADKKDATASVFVRTKAGTSLSNQQVEAIVHLVSAGITDMKPTDVSVIDATGRVLSAVGTGTVGTQGSDASDYETRTRTSVQALLDQVVGAGHAAVTVTADLDRDESHKTIEQFSQPDSTSPLASSRTSEKYSGTGNGSTATGVLGPDNIAVPSAAATAGAYESTTENLTNAVNKTTEDITSPAGGVARQSVAVVVDSAVKGVDLANLEATVAAAAGIDPARGDTLSVQAMAFDTSGAKAAQTALKAADAQAAKDRQASLLKQAAWAVLILIVFVVLLILGVRRSRRARREAIDLGLLRVSPVVEDDEPAAIEAAAAGLAAIEAAPVVLGNPPAQRKREEITAMADESPGEVAELLRGWLSEPTGRRR
jgi:flagellar M-ring protein FliF